MANITTSGSSGFPGVIDTASSVTDGASGTEIVANHPNGMTSAILNIQNNIGVGAQGTSTSTAARLLISIANNGTLTLSGSSLGTNPANGQILIGNATNNNLSLATLSVTGGISATTGAGTLTLDGVGGMRGARGVKITTATTPQSRLDIVADEAILQDVNGNARRVTNVATNVNFSTAGPNALNGRDQSGALSASSFTGIWLAASSTNTTAIASMSLSSPTVPNGYDYYGLIAVWPTTSTSSPTAGYTRGNRFRYNNGIKNFDGVPATSGFATATTLTVPWIASRAYIIFNNGTAGTYYHVSHSSFVVVSNATWFNGIAAGAVVGVSVAGPAWCDLMTTQTIYWGADDGNASMIFTMGYEIPGNLS